jgi:type II restriction enzyme
MSHDSGQMPKPGYCYVSDDGGKTLFSLYFDGGTERKLQIKNIGISNCLIHALWQFPPQELVAEG